jgi:hypothetical protein
MLALTRDSSVFMSSAQGAGDVLAAVTCFSAVAVDGDANSWATGVLGVDGGRGPGSVPLLRPGVLVVDPDCS